VAGDAVDHRSDIFSLGVLLIEAATGVHPFLRDTMAGTMTAVRAVRRNHRVHRPPRSAGSWVTMRRKWRG